MKEILNTKTEKIKWLKLAIKTGAIAIILYLVFGIFFGLIRVEGVAMSPRLEDGDLTLYQRGYQNAKKDDVVIFNVEDKNYISRIVATGGDVVDIDEDGVLYVNDEQVSDEPIFQVEQGQEIVGTYPDLVPEGFVYLLNDNLSAFEDSRNFGTVNITNIKGRAMSILRTRAV